VWRYSRATAPGFVSHEGLVDLSTEMVSFSATFLSVVHYRELLRNLVLKDLKLKYRGSVLGFLWSLINPLVMIVVYTVAFTFILRVRTEGFAFFVLLGILAWTFFVNSAVMSAGAIADNGGLVKSLFFPRAILPTATVLFNLAQYLLTAIVFLPLMLAIYGVPPSGSMLLFPAFLALQVVFTIGVALLLSTATAFFRDVRHFLDILLLTVLGDADLYDIQTVPKGLRLPVMLSPMSPFIVAYHQLFFFRRWPDATIWFLTTTYAFVALAGVAAFVTRQDRFADQI
jgi:ABC-2 type transport system permease protein